MKRKPGESNVKYRARMNETEHRVPRKEREGRAGGLGIFGIGCGGLLALILIFGLIYRSSEGTATFTVTKCEKVVQGAGENMTSQYLVWTEEGETFCIKDTIMFGRWDSSDLYGQIEAGTRYKARVAGWRIPFFSAHRNILSVEALAEDG